MSINGCIITFSISFVITSNLNQSSLIWATKYREPFSKIKIWVMFLENYLEKSAGSKMGMNFYQPASSY